MLYNIFFDPLCHFAFSAFPPSGLTGGTRESELTGTRMPILEPAYPVKPYTKRYSTVFPLDHPHKILPYFRFLRKIFT